MRNKKKYVDFTDEIKAEILPLLGIETDSAIGLKYRLGQATVSRYRNFLNINPSNLSIKGLATERVCSNCARVFRRSGSRAKQNYCSKECYASAQKKRDQDKLRYGAGWKEAKRETLERDIICQVCAKTSKEEGKELAVHHKLPFRFGGSNALSNLIVLCASCHRKVEHATEKALAGLDIQIEFVDSILRVKLKDKILLERSMKDVKINS